MASVATAPVARRKKTANVYGRTARPMFGAAHVDFFDDDEPVKEPAFKRMKSASTVVPQRQHIQVIKRATTSVIPSKVITAVPGREKRAERDAFDVPSSEDENDHVETRVLAPLVLRAQTKLVNDRVETVKPQSPVRVAPLPDEEHSAITSEQSDNTSTEMNEVDVMDMDPTSLSPAGSRRPGATGSALERLAARKRLAASGSAAIVSTQTSEAPAPRKVISRSTATSTGTVSRGESPAIPVEPRRRRVNTAQPVTKDIFDVPSDAESSSHAPATIHTPRSRSRRSPAVDRQSTPLKSSSAPEPLSAMLASDEIMTVVDVTSPVSSSEPRDALSTPRPERAQSKHGERGHSFTELGTLTPKQKQLWTDFLGSDDVQSAPTPATSMRRLALRDASDPPTTSVVIPAKRSQPHNTARRRTRAVDRLRASRLSSSDDESSGSSEGADDVEMIEVDDENVTTATQTDRLPRPQGPTLDTTTSQELKPSDGPRITYAKTRSHLADDGLDGMLADLPTETPQRAAATTRRVGRPAVDPAATFDLDDSDDHAQKGVRTIHELRAAGRSTRVMGEITDLLQEVAEHGPGARSRRRAALLELATKLLDSKFAEQFIAHGFEHQLLAEHSAATDSIADLILASAYMLLTAAELSSHTLMSFQKTLPWIAAGLRNQQSAAKLAKARSSNMSKAAQSDVVAFTEKLRDSAQFKNRQPQIITPRIIVLKSIDTLVGKLRSTGNRSSLFEASDLLALVPSGGLEASLQSTTDNLLQAELVVSILEALSTFSSVSEWPSEVMSAIGSLPKAMGSAPEARPHSKWLSYRLCLNVTNDPAIDQTIFASQHAVHHILNDIVAGFAALQNPASADEESSEEVNALNLDLLVLAIGSLGNLAEHSPEARSQTLLPDNLPNLQKVILIFRTGQEKLEDAESELEVQANVALGYLAVMLANMCQDAEVRGVIGKALPGANLDVLIGAIEEFVLHHQKVDGLSFEGAEGQEVWSVFTGRLQDVLRRLKGYET